MLDRRFRTGSGSPLAISHRPVDAVVTVVIPTRDRLGFLKEAVASVAGQSMAGWRLIVVDDASSDGTQEWLETLGDPRVETVRDTRHLERSTARNLGLARVATPYVLFLDDDDRLRARALGRLSAALAARPCAFAAVGAKADFDAGGHRKRSPHPPWHVTRPAWREVLAGWVAITGQMLFRTDRLRDAGGFDSTMALAEDQELWLRMGIEPATFIPWVVLDKRTHGPSRDTPDMELVHADIRSRFVEQLDGRDRLDAERAIRARAEFLGSVDAFDDDDFRLAARRLIRGARFSPAVMSSAVTGLGLNVSLGKALAGAMLPGSAAHVLRRGVRGIKALQHRDPHPGRS
jgi:glycosyltransferase involved in cell wall biosynthesis